MGLVLSLALPGLLFCAITQSRSGVCLSSYEWNSETGFRPTPATCSRKDSPPLVASLEFYGRSVGGLLSGRSGQSRENATVSLTELLKRRTLRSLSVVGVAALFLVFFG